MVEELILDMGILDIVHPNMSLLNETDQAAFAMTRRSGLGASDSSVILGVNKWTTIAELIEEKQSIGITAKELEVGQKESVRMGRDLEPIVLKKFEQWSGMQVEKPSPMYRIKEQPQLTINFDGVLDLGGQLVPVEAKCVSMFGDKYWDKTKSLSNLASGTKYSYYAPTVEEMIETVSKMYGIPSYYFTQVQQQMMGLNAEFGYLAVIFLKGWDFKVFKIYRDERIQEALVQHSQQVWLKVKGET